MLTQKYNFYPHFPAHMCWLVKISFLLYCINIGPPPQVTPSKSVEIRRNPSESVENPSKSVGIRRNPSRSVKIRRDPSRSVEFRRNPSQKNQLDCSK